MSKSLLVKPNYVRIYGHRGARGDIVENSIEGFNDNLAARELTNILRKELLDLFENIGGVHMQIGKSYNFKQGLNVESWSMLENIKNAIDPKRLINPGSLGLNLGEDSD